MDLKGRSMGKYRDDPRAIAGLVEDDQVHRDVYIDQEVFDLEMERLWSRTWIYVAHASQVPEPGDYFTTDVAGQPVIMVRQSDRSIRVLMNRCAHKGSKLVHRSSGNTGRSFSCPYHAWAYRTDGTLLAVPLRQGYDNTRMQECASGKGLARPGAMEEYRGFVFVRLSPEGPGFRDYFGDSLSSIDNMADRSPEGELEIAGGCLRFMHDCNWKMFVENLNDTMHPMVAHESSAGTAKKLWEGKPAGEPKPMAIEQFVPFVSDYKFFDDMGVRVFANGHSYTGVNFSIHSNYSAMPGYEARMTEVYGEERAKKILGTARHNTVYYPSLTIKGAIQSIRVARPMGPDKTLIESWTFRLKGAPPETPAAHPDVHPADQFADVGGGARRPARLPRHAGRPALLGQRLDQLAPRFPARGDRRRRSDRQRHQRYFHAQPVPRVGEIHDRDCRRRRERRAMNAAHPTREEIVDFIYHEARLIDEKRFDEWYELYADDAFYWIPVAPGQADGLNHVSLMHEDKLLLKLRIERLKNPKSYSQNPESRPHHVLQRPEIESADPAANRWVVRTAFVYLETRGDEQQVYGGVALHTLAMVEGRLRILQKRVNLLNSDAALPSVQMFL